VSNGARITGVESFGFTPRQARFLVIVLEHSGVWLPRQYRAFPGVAHGRRPHRFFEKLIAGGFASTDLAAPAHAGRICHVQYKPWYRLLGAPDHRHRRPMSVGRAVDSSTRWSSVRSGQDGSWCATAYSPDALPHTTVGGVVRPIPDPFRIGAAR
jgi:hypothetical protein